MGRVLRRRPRLIDVRGGLAATLLAAAVVLAGCGGDDERPRTTPYYADFSTGPATIDSPELRRIYGYLRIKEAAKLAAEPDDGKRVVLAAGCLACHQIGSEGNSGPGNNLSGIGARRTSAQIRAALLNATAPMPSYRELPREQVDDLVAYLAALRGGAPGAPPCPGDADCG